MVYFKYILILLSLAIATGVLVRLLRLWARSSQRAPMVAGTNRYELRSSGSDLPRVRHGEPEASLQ